MIHDPINLETFREKKGETTDMADLHRLKKVEDEALWCLWFAKDKVGIDYLSAGDISTILAEVFEVSVEEPAIRMALARARGKVHARTTARTKRFSIMKPGRDSVSAASVDQVFVVDPAQPQATFRKLADLFGGFVGTAKICDPYLDARTLQILEMIPDSCTIQLVSTPPQGNAGAFARHYSGHKAQHRNIDIHTIPRGQLHDRYAIVGKDMWLIGHSLNAIGTKQTFIVRLEGDIKREIEHWFDSTWQSASVLT